MKIPNVNRHSGQGRASGRVPESTSPLAPYLMWIPAFAGMTVFFIAISSYALEKTPFTYHPEVCEFSAVFPEAPYTAQRCDETDKTRCYDLTSFTKVYDMTSTVNFRVTCSAITEEMQKQYTEDVMKATLRAMTRRSTVKTFDTTYREEKEYRQAGLVGEGKAGLLPTIYIAQLWMGKRSALSIEAELIGEAHEKADKLFSDILKSVHFVTPEEEKAAKEKAEKEATEKKAEKEKPEASDAKPGE